MKPGGGYILSTVDYLSEDTPIENVQAFVDAGMKSGGILSASYYHWGENLIYAQV
jgi:hypothetical protein